MEAMQKMSDTVLVECPECGASELQKIISASGFRLKGTGWYETDFKNSPDKSSGGKGSGGKSEAKGGCGAGGCSTC